MTQFMRLPGFSLRGASVEIKLLITSFLMLASFGVVVGIVNYQVRTGLTASGSAAWYRGALANGGGPDTGENRRIDGDDGHGAGLSEAQGLDAKTPLELLDATHPHLFNQALLFFLLGHLLALCSLSRRLKNTLFVGGYLGVAVDTASPWLIRYGGAGFAWLQLMGHVLLVATFLGMVVLPLRDMWFRRPRLNGAARAKAALLLMAPLLWGVGGCADAGQGGADPADAQGAVSGRRAWPVMGTLLEVSLTGPDSTVIAEAIWAARSAVFRVDTLMSTYRTTSEVSELNRAAGTGAWTVLSPWTSDVLAAALAWAERSGGAFDPTVQPLMQVWGFRGGEPRVPAAGDLERARAEVGWARVGNDAHGSRARLPDAGMALDFGALAKGYAVDRALAAAEAAGAVSVMVDLGGNIGVFGPPPREAGAWTFGIRDPRANDRILGTLTLPAGGAVATSGDYEQGFVQGGVRYSHIMDPRTGSPARGVLSVTVATRDGLSADALSTTLFVLGADAGTALARSAYPDGGISAVWVLDGGADHVRPDDLVVFGDGAFARVELDAG